MFTECFVRILQEKNISAYSVAKQSGISQGLMNEYKNGKKLPTLQNLIKIADSLNCSVDILLGRTEIPTINGNNNINQQYIGGNATANIGTADSERSDADAQELLKMIKNLSVVQKAEIVLKINEMLKFNSKGE